MLIGGRAHTLEEAKQIGATGFPFAEISITDKKRFFQDELPGLKKIQEDSGITYLAHGPEEGNALEPAILRKQYLPRITELLECATELDIKTFTIHFWLDRRFIGKHARDEKKILLKEMTAVATEKKIQLCIENLSEQATDFADAFEIIECLGMTLDIGHGELLADKNTSYDFMRDCFDRIYHLHIHDNFGGKSPKDDIHLPPGEGKIDFASILSTIKKKGFNKTITLEVKPEYLLQGKKTVCELWYK